MNKLVKSLFKKNLRREKDKNEFKTRLDSDADLHKLLGAQGRETMLNNPEFVLVALDEIEDDIKVNYKKGPKKPDPNKPDPDVI